MNIQQQELMPRESLPVVYRYPVTRYTVGPIAAVWQYGGAIGKVIMIAAVAFILWQWQPVIVQQITAPQSTEQHIESDKVQIARISAQRDVGVAWANAFASIGKNMFPLMIVIALFVALFVVVWWQHKAEQKND